MFKEISPDQVAQIKASHPDAKLFDIRKLEDFTQLHPLGAEYYDQATAIEYGSNAEYDAPVIFICYKGISSKKFAQHLLELGFEELYSVKGGFEEWQRLGLPTNR